MSNNIGPTIPDFLSAKKKRAIDVPMRKFPWASSTVDEDVLSSNTLQQLRTALPPMDVIKKLSEVDSSLLDEMPEGEQFLASLASINALPLRLDLIIFKQRFQEILNDLKP
ncbi:hypothetical protein OSTOST_16448, partial [Ostertagia ostertagi]